MELNAAEAPVRQASLQLVDGGAALLRIDSNERNQSVRMLIGAAEQRVIMSSTALIEAHDREHARRLDLESIERTDHLRRRIALNVQPPLVEMGVEVDYARHRCASWLQVE